MIALAIIALVIVFLVAVTAAVVAWLRARGLAAEFAARARDHRAALDRLNADRDRLDRQLTNVNRSLAHALRAQDQLEHERDDAEAEAYRTFEAFEAMLAAVRANRDQALRDRDAHAERCTELVRQLAEREADAAAILRQRDSARGWLARTVQIARLLRGRLAESDAAFHAVRGMLAEAQAGIAPPPTPGPWPNTDRALPSTLSSERAP